MNLNIIEFDQIKPGRGGGTKYKNDYYLHPMSFKICLIVKIWELPKFSQLKIMNKVGATPPTITWYYYEMNKGPGIYNLNKG